jgi:hypothetical protein
MAPCSGGRRILPEPGPEDLPAETRRRPGAGLAPGAGPDPPIPRTFGAPSSRTSPPAGRSSSRGASLPGGAACGQIPCRPPGASSSPPDEGDCRPFRRMAGKPERGGSFPTIPAPPSGGPRSGAYSPDEANGLPRPPGPLRPSRAPARWPGRDADSRPHPSFRGPGRVRRRAPPMPLSSSLLFSLLFSVPPFRPSRGPPDRRPARRPRPLVAASLPGLLARPPSPGPLGEKGPQAARRRGKSTIRENATPEAKGADLR